MKEENSDFVNFIDPLGTDGTLQSMLLNDTKVNLPHGVFVAQAALFLKADKDKLVKDNIKMSKALQAAGIEL